MRYELMDYQRSAAIDVLNRLARARRDWAEGERSSFALSAITGSGKTVIATAAIEATLFGSADLGVDPDPSATFLWITDDPALNRQTRNRMLDASDLLAPKTLVEIDDGYLNAERGRTGLLLNMKLSKSSGSPVRTNLRRRRSGCADKRSAVATTLYLILDGVPRHGVADRKTIVQRLIHGNRVGRRCPWLGHLRDRAVPTAMGETPDRGLSRQRRHRQVPPRARQDGSAVQ